MEIGWLPCPTGVEVRSYRMTRLTDCRTPFGSEIVKHARRNSGPQRVCDRQDIDCFLHNGTRHWWKIARRGYEHADHAERYSTHCTLQSD